MLLAGLILILSTALRWGILGFGIVQFSRRRSSATARQGEDLERTRSRLDQTQRKWCGSIPVWCANAKLLCAVSMSSMWQAEISSVPIRRKRKSAIWHDQPSAVNAITNMLTMRIAMFAVASAVAEARWGRPRCPERRAIPVEHAGAAAAASRVGSALLAQNISHAGC